jgi:hypothetical protein
MGKIVGGIAVGLFIVALGTGFSEASEADSSMLVRCSVVTEIAQTYTSVDLTLQESKKDIFSVSEKFFPLTQRNLVSEIAENFRCRKETELSL